MKTINFLPVSDLARQEIQMPQPATQVVPDWYKHIKAMEDNAPTVKMCVPFADALRFGYVQKTWQDITIDKSDTGKPNFSFEKNPKIIGFRDSTHMPANYFDGHYQLEFTWQMYWYPKLPKGYSVLVTHPLNRHDLPFTTLTGVIDADDYLHGSVGNLPFMLKENFSGVIPKGTPMYQLIPFKRDDWESYEEKNDNSKTSNYGKIRSMGIAGYKKLIWKKKTFR